MAQSYYRDNWIQEKIDIISGQFVPNDVVSGWFLMDSFWPVGAMLGVYAFLCLKLGPGFVESRKPLKLKGFALAYNFIQVMLNGWFVWLISYYGWYFLMSKVFDLFDTEFIFDLSAE
ncbi:unnamed protein product [Bemisia tabaci]|uniref:Very-long-chain 3-oxoacyl-CoA synthase n=1 Tax=Bemisia tabaci TaxID=7038 RepID=A0A9P0C9G4_BEMTA|nr:unnamed protein product [Bemisia tabaci]